MCQWHVVHPSAGEWVLRGWPTQRARKLGRTWQMQLQKQVKVPLEGGEQWQELVPGGVCSYKLFEAHDEALQVDVVRCVFSNL